ncbi:MAG: SDR family oxidoreductase [Solirubrobacterales bacterium]
MEKPLAGKRAWVTGASSGIGEATARALARAGADVILSARREDRLKTLAQEIQHAGARATIKPVDVADRKAMEKLGRELEAMGGVDILINNAGLMPLSPLAEGRVDEWDRMIDVNIKGVLYAIHAVLGTMKSRKSGHIVNVSSVAGRVTSKDAAVYDATKFAVRAISDALRKEATEYGVRVTDIQPGAVATELGDSIKYEPIQQAMRERTGFFAQIDKFLQADDIANAILYAVTQPDYVDVCEIMVRPQTQEF